EAVDHCRSLISTTDHAVGALGVSAGHAVVFPVGGLEQFLVAVRVAFLEQVAGLLPTEDVKGRHAPRDAIVFAVAHQKLEEERRHVEFPSGLAIGEDGAEETADAGAAEEAILI